jgi:hypothetical protein
MVVRFTSTYAISAYHKLNNFNPPQITCKDNTVSDNES